MEQEKVLLLNGAVKREWGYLYFLDKDGDVARCKQNRGRKKNNPVKL